MSLRDSYALFVNFGMLELTDRVQTFRDYSFSNQLPYEEQNNSILSTWTSICPYVHFKHDILNFRFFLCCHTCFFKYLWLCNPGLSVQTFRPIIIIQRRGILSNPVRILRNLKVKSLKRETLIARLLSYIFIAKIYIGTWNKGQAVIRNYLFIILENTIVRSFLKAYTLHFTQFNKKSFSL